MGPAHDRPNSCPGLDPGWQPLSRQKEAIERRIAIVVKGYPRLSETFIVQEILALEARGLPLEIWSLRRPSDFAAHPMHKKVRASVRYLPEYLYQEPWRVLQGFAWSLRKPRFKRLVGAFWRDLKRDPTPNRLRRFGQALVLARELSPDIAHLHVHYLHTPASVVRYAALLTGGSWTFSAHAKDIWTTPGWEKREKIAESAWGVTCTAEGAAHLRALAPEPERVALAYHGLDLDRFPAPPQARPARDGSDPADPVRIMSVGRLVPKKGFDDLLKALAALPGDLHWRFAHVGSGALLPALRHEAKATGIAGKVAFLGAKLQPDVIALIRQADLFVLPAKEAASGDRDGLPNVLLEAASQRLAMVATDFAGIPELIRPGIEGELVPPGDWEALSNEINLLARNPARRGALGMAAHARLERDFSMDTGVDLLAQRFRRILGYEPAAKTRELA
jgi:glycosyltransferase involved in cell wall biosynthesis